jgi:uncharacterized protein (DUF1800 family)
MAFMDPYVVPLDETHLRHLLRRATFAVTRENINLWLGKTANETVGALLHETASAANPAPPLDPATRETWHDKPYSRESDAERNAQLKSWWIGRMLNEGVSLREKMTLFWHNLLVSSYDGVQDARYMYRQNALFRRFAFGNVRALLKEITVDPAMLRYLNGNANTKDAVNENYARELQELFTIGKGPEKAPGDYTHYTEDDIRAAARVLTGWTDNPADASSYFIPERHNTEDKQFSAAYQNTVIRGRSGEDGAKETDELLNMIFRQQETARFFCRKLYAFFVSPEIDEFVEREVITPMAATLRDANWEIKPVLRLLFQSRRFFDEATAGAMVRNPLDLVVGVFNYLRPYFSPDLPTPQSDLEGFTNLCAWLWQSADAQEMGILNHPNVAGWKAYYQTPLFDKLWINASTLAARADFADKLVSGFTIQTSRGERRFALDGIRLAMAVSQNPANGDDLVDKLSRDLVGVNLEQSQKLYLMDNVLAPGFFNARGAWDMNWSFYVADPTDAGKRQAVESRINNVVKFVLQMPESHIA